MITKDGAGRLPADEYIVVKTDASRALEERLPGVVHKQIAIDLVEVVRAGAAIGETSDQQVRPVAIARRAVVLDEDVCSE